MNAKQVKAQATIQLEFRWLGPSVSVGPATQAIMKGRTFGFTDVENVYQGDWYYLCKAYEIQVMGPL